MTGECFINSKDAFTTWGIFFGDNSLTALMTPASIKPFTENKSRTIDGKQVLVKNPRYDEREIQLTFYLKATSLSDFMTKYGSFTTELKTGQLNISTTYQPTVLYRTIYLSCAQYSQFNGRLGKFVLRLSEPNPANRAIV